MRTVEILSVFPFCRGMAASLCTGLWLSGLATAAGAGGLADALQHDWYQPRTEAFARDTAGLAEAAEAYCRASVSVDHGLETVRAPWTAALSSWEQLSGVSVGPVLERRVARALDFTPTRPKLIERAIKSAPANLVDMERVGTPAKGLPALEWLFWVRPVQPSTPGCDYAQLVAREIAQEAGALAAIRLASPDEAALRSELVNQWVAGAERLRWQGLEMPVRVAITTARGDAPDYPRHASGASAVAWAAQWNALRSMAVEAGESSLVAMLRSSGKPPLAADLERAVQEVDAVFTGLDGRDPKRVLAAAKALASLNKRVESDVAPALGVVIGFSDADGD